MGFFKEDNKAVLLIVDSPVLKLGKNAKALPLQYSIVLGINLNSFVVMSLLKFQFSLLATLRIEEKILDENWQQSLSDLKGFLHASKIKGVFGIYCIWPCYSVFVAFMVFGR